MTGRIKNDEDFASATAGPLTFVLFHSSWCPFCLAFLPAWKKTAAGGGAVFLEAAIDDLPAAEERYAVDVVPTVLRFENGHPAARLDGALGRGLSGTQLEAFVKGKNK
jgi:thiol-disulfide isomerase/thioredoxin